MSKYWEVFYKLYINLLAKTLHYLQRKKTVVTKGITVSNFKIWILKSDFLHDIVLNQVQRLPWWDLCGISPTTQLDRAGLFFMKYVKEDQL